ncbi:1-acyl-sn-glycerol-3-phosphate acyltransferase [Bacteroidales bacterium OttesenSCG-928-B11]|nr:1-acyl-sn-glycerol-3-phosphate acyltransferase [Bacteroidales bacterium OttesenSCG-928-B11]MDL2325909.1 1-acyl-sn-glycerol-3-phosphate acyltransferase [Bacteroidales bacterium OttesenSCG-928-A14]
MINFSDIDKYSWKYDLCNRYLRFNHNNIYYKEYRVVNQEDIPKPGEPVFIIGNHQNGLTDALTLLYMYPDKRQPVFIARGDIFKKDFVAKLLYFLKILPSFRNRDGNRGDVRANSGIFDIAAHVLNRGNTLVMFPEASHQSGNYLGTFKKGFPRVAFEAEAMADFKLGLKILPVNIYYEDYYNIRSRVLVTVGKTFTIEHLKELYETQPNNAYLKLNELAREKVKELTVDEGPEYYPQYDTIRKMIREDRLLKKGKNPDDLYEMKLEDMQIVEELDKMLECNPERHSKRMDDALYYERGLKKLGIKNWLVGKEITISSLLMKSLGLVLLFPFFLFGLITNGLPFFFPALLKRKIKDRQLHSSMNFAPGVILTFPLMYLTWFIIGWIVFTWWGGILLAFSAYAILIPFYSYKKAFAKLRGAWRYHRLMKNNNPLLSNLQRIKAEMIAHGLR